MYFPYLRGRQFELIAIRELLEKKLIGDKIIPIIEPVKDSTTLLKTLDIYKDKKQKIGVIINPKVGSVNNVFLERVIPYFESDYIIPVCILDEKIECLLEKNYKNLILVIKRNVRNIKEYKEIIKQLNVDYILIEDNTLAKKILSDESKVLLNDNFEKLDRNSDYLNKEDDFFSDSHLIFKEEGYNGFADYSIVGNEYSESGFAPYAVAIHLAYFDEDKYIFISHFVSDSNEDISDPAGKFGEAVKKVVDWTYSDEVVLTYGLKKFNELYTEGKYPGLGIVKKLSIMHHLELINKFINGEI